MANNLPIKDKMKNLDFLQKIVNSLPAIIFINDFQRSGDINSCFTTMLNQYGPNSNVSTNEELGVTRFDILREMVHPFDLAQMAIGLKLVNHSESESSYVSILRVKIPKQSKYRLFHCSNTILEKFPNGTIKKILGVASEITEIGYFANQLAVASKQVALEDSYHMLSNLTIREKKVLFMIVNGKTDNDISDKLLISIKTAWKLRRKLIQKTGVRNAIELAALAIENSTYLNPFDTISHISQSSKLSMEFS